MDVAHAPALDQRSQRERLTPMWIALRVSGLVCVHRPKPGWGVPDKSTEDGLEVIEAANAGEDQAKPGQYQQPPSDMSVEFTHSVLGLPSRVEPPPRSTISGSASRSFSSERMNLTEQR